MTPDTLRGLTIACLLAALGVLLWPPRSPLGIVAAVPVTAVLAAGLRPGRRWGGWVAALMIPYLAVAAMNILAGPMPRAPAIVLGVATALGFIAGLGWTRSTGATLKG
ncbi:MAG: hypothetical protein JSV45_14830 [Chromatiales bacterium]|nr:MAG: hypothetical protein JSV45_14830 [Chromatiales bacterium]